MANIILIQEKEYYLLQAKITVLDQQESEDLCQAFDKMVNLDRPVILDLSSIQKIKRKAVSVLKRLATNCVEKNLPVILLVEKNIHQFLFDHGLTYLIPSFCDMQEALLNLPSESRSNKISSIASSFLQGTIKSTQYTFKTLCNLDVSPQEHYIRGEGPLPEADLASVINVQAEDVHVLLVLRMQKETLLSLMKRMLEDDQLELGPETTSATMEFLNCLTGRLKNELREIRFNSGIPTLIQNNLLNERPMSLMMERNSTIIPFASDFGHFSVEFMAYYALTEHFAKTTKKQQVVA